MGVDEKSFRAWSRHFRRKRKSVVSSRALSATETPPRRARDTARPASMSAALGLMGVPPSDDLEASWDAAVDAAVSVVARVRAGVAATAAGPSDARAAADLVAALEEATASVTFDEEFVAALGVANGHDLLMRLVSHPDESVAAAAAECICACVDAVPPGLRFPSRGALGAAPTHTTLHVGRLGAPFELRLRHVRESHLGGEKKSIPNIVWHSGVALARWLSRRSELVTGREALEIGAGLGVPGMTAAAVGAARVAITDVDGAAVRNARYNVARGGRAGAGAGARADPGAEVPAKADETLFFAADRAFAAEAMTRIASRCVAETMDWNDTEPLLGGLRERLERDARWRRAGNAGDDDAFDDDGGEGSTSGLSGSGSSSSPADASERRFEMILGADVVHEEGMADGVVRCLVECLDRERGVGLIVNPSPAHRAGADALPGLLAHAGFRVVKTKVTSALLRVGMEEETEDVALEFFAVTWAESGAVTPDISDAGDAWTEWC